MVYWPRLRDDIRKIKPVEFEGNSDKELSHREFAMTFSDLLTRLNESAESSNVVPDSGVHYAGEFFTHPRYLDGVSRAAYWDNSVRDPLRKHADLRIKPGDALTAFFEGPTFADCGSVLYAVTLRTLEMYMGTDRFNLLFGHPLANFIITPSLYGSSQELTERPRQKSDLSNPLLFLFDAKEGQLTEEDIDVGDILHIEGVGGYQSKHLDGYAGGWNIICVGTSDAGEKLYLGFGAKEFPSPRTYSQIVQTLIDAYYAGDDVSEKEKSLTPVGGIPIRLRIKPDVLKEFATAPIQEGWWQRNVKVDEGQESVGQLSYISGISAETKGNTFDSYQADTTQRQALLQLSIQFAESVTRSKTSFGLVLTGSPGIGKTHLAHATAQRVSQSRKVAYLDAHTTGSIFDKLSSKGESPPSEGAFRETIKQLIKGSRLVVLDDFNGHVLEGYVLDEVLRLAQETGMSYLITSNESVPLAHFGTRVEFNDLSRDVLVLDGLEMESWRSGWWEMIDQDDRSTFHNIIEAFLNQDSSQSRGILLTNQMYLELQQQIEENDKTAMYDAYKIPYKAELLSAADIHVFNFTNINSYDVGSFLTLFPELIEERKQFLIICDDYDDFANNVLHRFQDSHFKKNKQRLTDRLNTVIYGFQRTGYMRSIESEASKEENVKNSLRN